MADPGSAVGVIILVVCLLLLEFGISLCMGGGQKIRRCCGCTTLDDEAAEDARDTDKRSKTVKKTMGEGTYVQRGMDAVGGMILSPWAHQRMVPEEPAPAKVPFQGVYLPPDPNMPKSPPPQHP